MGLPDSQVGRLATVELAGPPPPPFPDYLIKALTDPTSVRRSCCSTTAGS
jgi:hypothetical protein